MSKEKIIGISMADSKSVEIVEARHLLIDSLLIGGKEKTKKVDGLFEVRIGAIRDRSIKKRTAERLVVK